MSESTETTRLKFKYHELPAEQKLTLLERVRRRLEAEGDILFAYVHGSFIEKDAFRDLDVAIWLKDAGEAFHYAVELSAKLEIEIRAPVEVHALNEAPLPFKHHVFKTGRLLFSRNESLRLRLNDEVARQYQDLKQLTEIALKSTLS